MLNVDETEILHDVIHFNSILNIVTATILTRKWALVENSLYTDPVLE